VSEKTTTRPKNDEENYKEIKRRYRISSKFLIKLGALSFYRAEYLN